MVDDRAVILLSVDDSGSDEVIHGPDGGLRKQRGKGET
jgi:hypothetical protein